ncbi:hypothetical protein AYI69_g9047, partial [Smittium culicis]
MTRLPTSKDGILDELLVLRV